MLWCYDKAIADDLSSAINVESGAESSVKVIGPEGIIPLIAQIKEDKISFPLVCLTRHPDTPIDTQRANFTAMHKGVPMVFEDKENNIYFEKCVPIKLSYTLSVLTTNTADMDEILRELMFRYIDTYFLDIDVPYESKRRIRFGVKLDYDSIKKESASLEYIETGSLYQSSMDLICEGAVLLSYTPRKIMRYEDTKVEAKQGV